jgi:histidyl-tRNA synthetase
MTVPGAAETFDRPCDVFFVTLGDAARLWGLARAAELRARGLRAEIEHRNTSMKAQMKRADRVRARTVVVVGDSELERGEAQLRDMKTSEQITVAAADLFAMIDQRLEQA